MDVSLNSFPVFHLSGWVFLSHFYIQCRLHSISISHSGTFRLITQVATVSYACMIFGMQAVHTLYSFIPESDTGHLLHLYNADGLNTHSSLFTNPLQPFQFCSSCHFCICCNNLPRYKHLESVKAFLFKEMYVSNTESWKEYCCQNSKHCWAFFLTPQIRRMQATS